MASGADTADGGVAILPSGEIKRKRTVLSPVLTLVFLALLSIGLINLYSATSGDGVFYAQLRHAAMGLVVFGFCGWLLPPRHVNTYSYWFYGFTLFLLLAVLVIGKIGGGSQRWIELGPLRGQPSELAKIAIAIITARFFATSKLTRAYKLRDLWPLGLMLGGIGGLIFVQPDFGTAGVCILIAVSQILFVRLDWRSLGLIAATGIAAAPAAWNFLLEDYQRARILSFLSPGLDPHGKGYNALQSLVAVGSGGMNGKGFLEGTQSQLKFLPMRHTDFVFSVFAEEHGFWGCTLLFALFAILTYVALEIARSAKDTFSCLLSVGLAAFIFLEFIINIAMVLRMFPVVGLPLPLLSYGGSAMITICAALGLLVAVDRDNHGLFKKSQSLTRTSQ